MSPTLVVVLVAVAGVVGIALGYLARWLLSVGKKGSIDLEIKKIQLKAKEDAEQITSKAQDKALQILDEARKEAKEKVSESKKTEDRLIKKEEFLDKRQLDIDKEIEKIKGKADEIRAIREEAEKVRDAEIEKLEKLSSLSVDDARNELLKKIEQQYEEDLLARMQKLDVIGKEKMEKKAQEILVSSIHRLGNSVSSDVMSTSVIIPSDEIKGKIIGKEGRNIKAFERAAGVEVIIDDTPKTVLISAYDPVRRHIARLALENLIIDGRIQPARIEEMVQSASKEINKIIKEKGEQAAFECNVYGLDERILSILGRLHFRTSYGQNVLQHSMEVAHIAGMIAEQVGADPKVARAGGLVHDIGKAVDHEVPGTHVDIGIRILQKFGASAAIVDAMKSHHEEYPYETLESKIVQVADAISAARPGARRDTVENYLKRLEELETLASGVTGVSTAYAISAGREVRVFVNPEDVNDMEARTIARKIADSIESELTYPGEIKVNVIRENRVIEYAR